MLEILLTRPREFLCTIVILVGLSSQPSLSQGLQLDDVPGLVDFDFALGLPNPRTIAVLKAASPDKHLYYLLPNTLELQRRSSGEPAVSLLYIRSGKVVTWGELNLSIIPVLRGDDVDTVISEIQTVDPSATFSVIMPPKSWFYFDGPAMVRTRLIVKEPESNPLRTASAFRVTLSSIGVRSLLLLGSYRQTAITVGLSFTLRGVQRDGAGTTSIVERDQAISASIDGFCAIFPHLVTEVVTGRRGCEAQKWDQRLIRRIQSVLRKRGASHLVIDGVFGPETEFELRKSQAAENLTVDGIPSLEVLGKLE